MGAHLQTSVQPGKGDITVDISWGDLRAISIVLSFQVGMGIRYRYWAWVFESGHDYALIECSSSSRCTLGFCRCGSLHFHNKQSERWTGGQPTSQAGCLKFKVEIAVRGKLRWGVGWGRDLSAVKTMM